LTTREAADQLHVSKATLYRLTRAGLLPSVRLSPRGQLRFRVEDLDALIQNGRAA